MSLSLICFLQFPFLLISSLPALGFYNCALFPVLYSLYFSSVFMSVFVRSFCVSVSIHCLAVLFPAVLSSDRLTPSWLVVLLNKHSVIRYLPAFLCLHLCPPASSPSMTRSNSLFLLGSFHNGDGSCCFSGRLYLLTMTDEFWIYLRPN